MKYDLSTHAGILARDTEADQAIHDAKDRSCQNASSTGAKQCSPTLTECPVCKNDITKMPDSCVFKAKGKQNGQA